MGQTQTIQAAQPAVENSHIKEASVLSRRYILGATAGILVMATGVATSMYVLTHSPSAETYSPLLAKKVKMEQDLGLMPFDNKEDLVNRVMQSATDPQAKLKLPSTFKSIDEYFNLINSPEFKAIQSQYNSRQLSDITFTLLPIFAGMAVMIPLFNYALYGTLGSGTRKRNRFVQWLKDTYDDALDLRNNFRA